MSLRILAINPGSTSTKIAVYDGEEETFIKNIKHPAEQLAAFATIASQFSFRENVILSELAAAGQDTRALDAIVGRGGLVKPVESGVYEVNEALLADLRHPLMGEHASNLGGLIAHDIACSLPGNVKAYITDPVVVDEMEEVARVSGHPSFRRVSIFHALNQKAIARLHARMTGKKYEDMNLVVAHLGGGISVAAHREGRVIDVNNALDGEGPFSPERSGTLPAGQLVDLCFSGTKTREEMRRLVTGEGGLVAHLGTNDARVVEQKALDDPRYKLVRDAMAYQIGKAIGEMAAVLRGKVDAILVTGGIAHDPYLVGSVREMVSFIAPFAVYPGEDEMRALATNILMVHRGELPVKIYK
ncbi:MAG: butyrate kinase [Odoribacteraceae bacterium]|jgi:butyrate kinase|nr:butyrate kinase [Odoribacteraceae bacterium]